MHLMEGDVTVRGADLGKHEEITHFGDHTH